MFRKHWFRRFRRRAVKPLVMASIAGALVMSLTVTTTTRAEATPAVAVAPVIAAAEGVLAGGVRLALPSILSIAIATTPVGWIIAGGLAIGAIGVGLYSTRDYWVPFVTGAFGGAKADFKGDAGGVYFAGMKAAVTSFPAAGSTRTVTAQISVPNTVSGTFSMGWRISCKENSTGVVTQTNMWADFAMSNTKVATSSAFCGQYQTIVGYRGGAPSSHPTLPGKTSTGTGSRSGPENIVQGGDMLQGGFDPKGADVKYKTTSECIDDGGLKSNISAEWFGNEGGAKMPSCAAAGKGHGTGKSSIEGYAPTAPGVPGTTAEPIWSTEAPPADADHPLCGPQRPGPGCEMKILIDGKPCAVGVWECENWTELWKDPATSPRVGCTYGPYTLAVDLCKIMEPAYRPGGAPATEANMDADPATRNYTQPGGQTYQAPQTGTSPGTGTSGFPTTGTNGNPEDPCLKDAWSWTPADWVKNPVVCAIQDVFVPKKDIQARSNELKQKAMDTVPIAWLSPNLSGPGGGGCPNWRINVGELSKNVVCESSFTAALTGVRGPLFGLVAAAMVWPLIRGIWYASIPVLRVSPGGSK